MLNKYNDYILDLLVEAVVNKETALFISNNMKRLLHKIDHQIARRLLDDSYHIERDNFKVTYLDLDYSDKDKVSFITVPKAAEIIDNHVSYRGNVPLHGFDRFNYDESDVYTKNRVVTTIGRLIGKLYTEYVPSGKPGFDIESFSTMFKTSRNTVAKFEMVKGDDIIHWYLEDNYSDDADDDTTLGNSCMKDEDCSSYMEFYSYNPNAVSMLILKDPTDDDKIIGRSLIWNLNLPKGRKFMDRIYTVNFEDIQLFINYAIENDWLYKKKQSYSYQEIIDPKKECDENVVLVVNGMEPTASYPYMDSMYNYNSVIQVLSNNKNYIERNYSNKDKHGNEINVNDLQDANGGPTTEYFEEYDGYYIEDDLIYCEKGDAHKKPEDCKYLPYYDEYCTNDYFDESIVKCKYHDNDDDIYIDIDEAIYLELYDEFMSPDYQAERLFVQDNDDRLIKKKDAVYCKTEEEWLYKDDAVKVFSNFNKTRYDWIHKGLKSLYFKKDDEFYHISLKNKNK